MLRISILYIMAPIVWVIGATACDPAISAGTVTQKGDSSASRYHPALLLHTTLQAIDPSVLELVPPLGYRQSDDSPDRLFTEGSVQASRQGMKIRFQHAQVGDRAWVEAYYCPKAETGLCTFRPIEVSFKRSGPGYKSFHLPDPAS